MSHPTPRAVRFFTPMLTLMLLAGGDDRSVKAQQPAPPAVGEFRGVGTAVQFDISPPLSSVIPLDAPFDQTVSVIPERPTRIEGPLGPQDIDQMVQSETALLDIPTPGISFDGPGNISNTTPPDPVGDVGPNHYVAMSNLSFQIFSKTGVSLYGPALNNTLWAGFGGACQNQNAGDPIVLHDQLADRWILTQFTATGDPNFYNCVAVSTTPDPTGAYYRYAFSTGPNFPDYPKYGVWPDALYVSTREFVGTAGPFAGVGAYAINRAQLIAGNPATQVISFLVPPGGAVYNIGDGLLPADLDGATPPPAGRPGFFIGSMDQGGPYGAPQDALTLWKFAANFTTPASSSFVLANTLPVAVFDSIFPCTPSVRACIPQPGTAVKLDILSYRQRAMHRLAYRNFGTHESLVSNQSVDASGIAGLRWWEVRSPDSSPVVFQQGTYAPGLTDTVHRWMGSIAMDASGNMALGYSASSATTTFPSSWYTGRLVTDPLGQMSQGEGSFINGTGSQTSTSSRWGDYSSMNVDPSDDCTFWYVNEYLPMTSNNGWRLRIGSFRFPSCVSPPVSASEAYATGYVTPLVVAAPGVLANDTSSVAMTAVLVSAVAHGTLALAADGSFGYTPAAGYVGPDSFTYRAVNSSGAGNIATVSITVAQPTDAQPPSALFAYSVVGNLVTLRWTPPSVGPAPTGYVLEGGINPGEVLASLPTGGPQPIYRVIAPTGSFYVRIHTLAAGSRSAASNEIRIHVNVPVPPSAPTDLVGLVDGSTLALAWRNTFEGGAPTSMQLLVSGAFAGVLPIGSGDSFAFAGVPPGTYTLRVSATNAGGASPPSNPVTLTFPGACSGVPGAPSGLFAYKIGSEIFVLWDPPATGPAPTSYELIVTGSFTGSLHTPGRALNGGVGPGSYNLSVRGHNGCGAGPATSVQTIAIP